MEKQELQEMVKAHLSIRQMAKKTGKSPTSIRYWLKKHGLKTKIERYNRGGENTKPQKYQKPYLCENCGEDDPERFYHARTRCKNCHNQKQMERVKEIKRLGVEYKGGKCEKCGYNKNLAALDFHHLDPSKKDINWNTSRHWGWKRQKRELDKCILVCRNCHAEIHYPDHQNTKKPPVGRALGDE